jgi:heterodisulfide reductase subunit A-like polyferredoxin
MFMPTFVNKHPGLNPTTRQAQQKSNTYVKAAIAKARYAKSLFPIRLNLKNRGSNSEGVAGLKASLALSKMGDSISHREENLVS